jgi:hypothetical protein
MPLADYQVEWEGQAIPIQSAMLRLETGNFPESMSIHHQRYGTLRISSPGLFGFDYISETNAPAPVHTGIGFGLHRTYASGAAAPGFLNRNDILTLIHSEFPALEDELNAFRSRVRGKTQNVQREGLRRMIRREENRSGRHMPNELRQEAEEMLGENHPVRGAFNVKKNFSQINTSLFQGGKKRRKTLRKTKKRKQTRRRH